jgi:hypothetical protein
VHQHTKTAGFGDHEGLASRVGRVGRSPVTAEVDVMGVSPRQNPAGVDLGRQNTVQAGDHCDRRSFTPPWCAEDRARWRYGGPTSWELII